VEVLRSNAVLTKGLPFPDGVRVGDLVILSGQIGIKPGTLELAAGGIEPEARQTFENLRLTLGAHGLQLSDIVRVQVMLADMSEWQRFNQVYLEFFPDAAPARSAFGANGLALGARVEVEAFAVRR
jgi:2-iminobutanoate/2-iminopropanoate deaminase